MRPCTPCAGLAKPTARSFPDRLPRDPNSLYCLFVCGWLLRSKRMGALEQSVSWDGALQSTIPRLQRPGVLQARLKWVFCYLCFLYLPRSVSTIETCSRVKRVIFSRLEFLLSRLAPQSKARYFLQAPPRCFLWSGVILFLAKRDLSFGALMFRLANCV